MISLVLLSSYIKILKHFEVILATILGQIVKLILCEKYFSFFSNVIIIYFTIIRADCRAAILPRMVTIIREFLETDQSSEQGKLVRARLCFLLTQNPSFFIKFMKICF